MEQPKGAKMPQGPIMIMVHVASTNVPFTSESKDAIADIPEMEDEIELAVWEAARDLGRYLSEQKKALDARKKIKMFEAYTKELAIALQDLTGKDHAIIEAQLRDVLAKKYTKFIDTDEPVKQEAANDSPQ
jgi:DNA topoisomerase-6 subunit B